jgi:hypothetical protein
LTSVIAFGLLLVQVNLLWVAESHRHDTELIGSGRWAAIDRCGAQQSPAAGAEYLCTVCQIVRHNAARPSTGAPAVQPIASVTFPVAATANKLRSYRPAVIYGRAPPPPDDSPSVLTAV